MKINIFALLNLNALVRFVDSPIYLASFKILNTRSNLSALNATRDCEPAKSRETYFGMVANKSMIP